MSRRILTRFRWYLRILLMAAIVGVPHTSMCQGQVVTAAISSHLLNQDDNRPIEELEALRFKDLSEESVQTECEAWVTQNQWEFGRRLADIRRTGSGVTADDVRKLLLGLRTREAAEYEMRTKDAGAVRDSGIRLLTAWAHYPMDGSDPAYLGRVGVQAREVISAGSKDPLVRAMAECYAPDGDYSSTQATLSAMAKELSEAGYGSSFRFLVHRNRLTLATRQNAPDRNAIAEEVVQSILAYVDEASKNHDAAPLTWYYVSSLSNMLTEPERVALYRGLLLSDQADPYVRHMYIGVFSNQTAWRIRGQGFADSVTADAWEQFSRLNDKASLHFRKAWLLRPDLPDAPASMISVSNASSGREAWTPRQWFELSCHARFDFALNYNSYMYPLLPRWGGSYAEMLEFGKECAETKAFETQVPWFLVDFIRQIAEETGDAAWENPRIVSTLERFWKDMDTWAADNPGKRDETRWQDQFALQAAVMLRNGRYAEAAAVLDQASSPPSQGPLQHLLGDPSWAVSMAFALAPEEAAPLVEVERQFGQTFDPQLTTADFEKAIAVVTEAQKQHPDSRASRYLGVREDCLRKQMAFQNGDAVSLTFDSPLTSWIVRNGTAAVESADSILLTSPQGGLTTASLSPHCPFPPPYTLTATLERIAGAESLSELAINVGPVGQQTMLGAPGGMAFVLTDEPRTAGTWVPGSRVEERFPFDDSDNRTEIELKIWPETYSMRVNDQPVPIQPVPRFAPNSRFSIGGNPYQQDSGEMRISNVRIQKLQDPPPEQ